MKPLLSLSASLFALGLAGCGEESDTMPVDGRDFDGVAYGESAPYTGKVIDGYLVNARVWLDMDGDGQYTPGPLTVTLDNGATVELASGEPTAMTGAGGNFALDTAELAVPASVGPDLDPRDFPLIALALPGKTLEETPSGDVPVARAYLMSAAPGVRNVTPLTTLARYRSLVGLPAGTGDDLAESLSELNLVRDYVMAGDDRAHAYARALVRFMASQIPDGYNDLLGRSGSDGTERYLSPQGVRLLGISLVRQANTVVALVDDAASGRYRNVDIQSLALPTVPLELSDPTLLTSQRVYAQPERSQTLPSNLSDLDLSAELTFDYTEAGRLKSVSADGCLAPSMPELARLISVNGYMAELPTQWLPAAALSSQSRIHYDVEGVDERLEFDWDNRQIRFETTTSCHQHNDVYAGSSELGGTPEITYSWTLAEGALAELVAQLPQPGGGTLTRTLVPDTSNAADQFPGYRLSEQGSAVASLVFDATAQGCDVDIEAKDAPLAVSARQPFTVTSDAPLPAGLVDLALELDAREFSYPGEEDSLSTSRPLRYGVLDLATAGLDNVDSDGAFEWLMLYPALGGAGFIDGQPNLIREAYLKKYSGSQACGREFGDLPSSAFARVEYRYQSLSGYLVGLLQ